MALQKETIHFPVTNYIIMDESYGVDSTFRKARCYKSYKSVMNT